MKEKKKRRIGWKVVDLDRDDGRTASGMWALLKLEILGDVVTPFEPAYLHQHPQSTAGVDGSWVEIVKHRTNRLKVLSARPFRVSEAQKDVWQIRPRRRIIWLTPSTPWYRQPTGVKLFGRSFYEYRIGKMHTAPLSYDPTRDCAPGLHFFDTQKDALLWARYA